GVGQSEPASSLVLQDAPLIAAGHAARWFPAVSGKDGFATLLKRADALGMLDVVLGSTFNDQQGDEAHEHRGARIAHTSVRAEGHESTRTQSRTRPGKSHALLAKQHGFSEG